MYTLTKAKYRNYETARSLGCTPVEIYVGTEYGSWTIETEQLTPNIILEQHKDSSVVERLLAVLRSLHEHGIAPQATEATSIAVRDGRIIFLGPIYINAYDEFDPDEYSSVIAELTETTHTKKITSGTKELTIYQLASSLDIAPQIVDVQQDDPTTKITTKKYPFSLHTAMKYKLRITEQQKHLALDRLRTLHSFGILQGDMTEDNLVCDINGEDVRIIDFGLSMMVSDLSPSDIEEYILGWDEQWSGDFSVASAKAMEMKMMRSVLDEF